MSCTGTGTARDIAGPPQLPLEAIETITTGLTGTERASTMVIGGVVVILHGLGRKTEVVDLAAPAAVVYRIQELIGSDNRLSGGGWWGTWRQ